MSRLLCNPLIKELRKLHFRFDDQTSTSRISYNSQTGDRAVLPTGNTIDEKNMVTILYQAGLKKEQVDSIVDAVKAESGKV